MPGAPCAPIAVAVGRRGDDSSSETLVPDGLTVRADGVLLALAEILLEAEGTDSILYTGQVRAGHGWGQMVLDLVVEAPEHEPGEAATARVATEVEGEDGLVHRQEGERLGRAKYPQHHRQVERGMRGEQHALEDRGPVRRRTRSCAPET